MWHFTVSRHFARFLVALSIILLPLHVGAQDEGVWLADSNACHANQGTFQVVDDSCRDVQVFLPSVFNPAPRALEFARCAEGIQAACAALFDETPAVESETFMADDASDHPNRLHGPYSTIQSPQRSSTDPLWRESRVNPSAPKP